MATAQKAPALSKRMQAVRGKVDRSKFYAVDEALSLVKATAVAKFDESVDVAVNLGVDAKKSDQTVRGSVVLPAGTGKTVRVAVFAQGEKAKLAQEAGADIVGFDDLAAKIKEGFMDFDVVIATPDAMKVVGQLGQILGPRGLMPNPKVGTVAADVVQAVKNARAGQVQYRTDKARHRPVHDRSRVVRARAAEVEPARADRGAEQGQAVGHQGRVPEEGQRLEHDGRRRSAWTRRRWRSRRRSRGQRSKPILRDCRGRPRRTVKDRWSGSSNRAGRTARGNRPIPDRRTRPPDPAQMVPSYRIFLDAWSPQVRTGRIGAAGGAGSRQRGQVSKKWR